MNFDKSSQNLPGIKSSNNQINFQMSPKFKINSNTVRNFSSMIANTNNIHRNKHHANTGTEPSFESIGSKASLTIGM